MKRIDEIDLKNKKVIIRVDYNVPLDKNLNIVDDNRIKESLKTINYCLDNNCSIILLSHLGKVKSEDDLKTKSLKPIAKRLSELLNREIIFTGEARGEIVDETVLNMQPKDIVLFENTRFLDLDGKLESGCDLELSKYWASLADIFINDAFGTIHRAHASNVGIAKYIKESCIGFLVQKELDNLNQITNNPELPFTVILGGAKVSDKIGVIKNLVKKADYILIGGAMAYTFLKAKGESVGKSLVDEDSLEFAREMLNTTNKIILPIDHLVSDNTLNSNYKVKEKIENDDIGLDIGPKTIESFKSYLTKSKTIFWNGPMGYYENETYQKGTKALCEIISRIEATSIVGGGDSASCVINLGYKDKFTHVSTGGGASLELLEGKELPGIEAIK
ncbi:MAG: phosphoglycerate kinase [Bacilli bacterium]|nr:phosphoglycerate kinase [Bacilli bacterium]